MSMTRAEFVAETASRTYRYSPSQWSAQDVIESARRLADALEQTPDCPWLVNLREAKAIVERTCDNPSMHPLACGCIR